MQFVRTLQFLSFILILISTQDLFSQERFSKKYKIGGVLLEETRTGQLSVLELGVKESYLRVIEPDLITERTVPLKVFTASKSRPYGYAPVLSFYPDSIKSFLIRGYQDTEDIWQLRMNTGAEIPSFMSNYNFAVANPRLYTNYQAEVNSDPLYNFQYTTSKCVLSSDSNFILVSHKSEEGLAQHPYTLKVFDKAFNELASHMLNFQPLISNKNARILDLRGDSEGGAYVLVMQELSEKESNSGFRERSMFLYYLGLNGEKSTYKIPFQIDKIPYDANFISFDSDQILIAGVYMESFISGLSPAGYYLYRADLIDKASSKLYSYPFSNNLYGDLELNGTKGLERKGQGVFLQDHFMINDGEDVILFYSAIEEGFSSTSVRSLDFLKNNGCLLICFNLENGKENWSHASPKVKPVYETASQSFDAAILDGARILIFTNRKNPSAKHQAVYRVIDIETGEESDFKPVFSSPQYFYYTNEIFKSKLSGDLIGKIKAGDDWKFFRLNIGNLK